MSHSYIPLDQFKKKWIFNHNELPVSEQDKLMIKPLSDKSSMKLWNMLISNKSSRSDLFSKGDWAARSNSWKKSDQWQTSWDSDTPELPQLLDEYIQWPDDTLVYFAYDKYQLIESTWEVFKRNWKCFLFFDDGPLLISPNFRQAVWFQQDGTYQLGIRS
ncbi:MAG: DUF2947 domain-containing protein [Parashewanella sp.]